MVANSGLESIKAAVHRVELSFDFAELSEHFTEDTVNQNGEVRIRGRRGKIGGRVGL